MPICSEPRVLNRIQNIGSIYYIDDTCFNSFSKKRAKKFRPSSNRHKNIHHNFYNLCTISCRKYVSACAHAQMKTGRDIYKDEWIFVPPGRIQQQLHDRPIRSGQLVRICVPKEDMICNWRNKRYFQQSLSSSLKFSWYY